MMSIVAANEHRFRLRFSVLFEGEPQLDMWQTGNRKKIIQAAFDGWEIWSRDNCEPNAWLLQMFEGSTLIEERGKNTELILPMFICN